LTASVIFCETKNNKSDTWFRWFRTERRQGCSPQAGALPAESGRIFSLQKDKKTKKLDKNTLFYAGFFIL
jgi:hypothetical protein